MGRLAGGTLYCNPVNYKATEEQKEMYLKPVAIDGAPAASAMTEFNAGSDIFSMELKLMERGDKIIVKGKKVFITNGMIADYIILYGRRNNGQLGAVIIDTEHQTLKNFRAARIRTYGMTDAFVSRLIFDKVEVPKENMLQGNGLEIAFHQLTEERLVISAEALGDAMKKLLYSHTYALQRRQFDKKLHEYQVIRFPISRNIRMMNLLVSALLQYTRQLDAHPELAGSKLMAAQAMGLKLFSSQPSDSVSCIWLPEGVSDSQFRGILKDRFGCSVAGGQGDLKGKVFRISHMGYVDPVETIGLIAAIEYALAECGIAVEIGRGVSAAAKVLKDWK